MVSHDDMKIYKTYEISVNHIKVDTKGTYIPRIIGKIIIIT